jgi:hypothetical protein
MRITDALTDFLEAKRAGNRSEKTGVDTDEIRYLIERRAIKAVQNLNRHIMIPLSDLKRLERLSGLLGLEGQPIHQSEAARKYNLKQPSISNWRRSGQPLTKSG